MVPKNDKVIIVNLRAEKCKRKKPKKVNRKIKKKTFFKGFQQGSLVQIRTKYLQSAKHENWEAELLLFE